MLQFPKCCSIQEIKNSEICVRDFCSWPEGGQVFTASHAVQTAEVMKRFEQVCLQEQPTYVLVVGDVNSTIACALVASKLSIKVVHVEAGLRSFDRTMPEEINRVLTDAISDLLFITEESASVNLRHEGIPKEKIHFVGNVMIDTLVKHRYKAGQSDVLHRLGLTNSYHRGPGSDADADDATTPYAVLTLHRPSNVDNKRKFWDIIQGLKLVSRELPILFPVHPRTSSRIEDFRFAYHFKWISGSEKLSAGNSNSINCVDPLGYLDFLQLMSNAKLVLTDSGGIQEETTILKVPCITIRDNTERPVTVTHGTNRVVGTTTEGIIRGSREALDGRKKETGAPPLWDGRAAERIVEILVR